jgi:nitrate reductase (NAD(P)H)
MPTPEKVKGEIVTRKYTPTSSIHERGHVDFVIKIYRKCEQFPNGGLMTQHLESMNIGDKLSIEGPRGRLAYFGDGNFVIDKKEKKKTRIGMIAGGTGITP